MHVWLVLIDVSAALAGRVAADCFTTLHQPDVPYGWGIFNISFLAPVLLHMPNVSTMPSVNVAFHEQHGRAVSVLAQVLNPGCSQGRSAQAGPRRHTFSKIPNSTHLRFALSPGLRYQACQPSSLVP